MPISISDFKNVEGFFGDVIETMKDDSLRTLLDKDFERQIRQFDEMLEILKKKTNVDQIINEYKKKQLDDSTRFKSLVSEIRAGCFLVINMYPVKFINIGTIKTPDIQTNILGRNAFVEVKRIDTREFTQGSIISELQSKKLPYDILITVEKKFFKAKNLVDELIEYFPDPKQISDEFKEYPFPHGEFSIRNAKTTPYYGPIISDTVPIKKESVTEEDDAYISRDQLDAAIISDLEKGVSQLTSFAKENDLCFILLDNHDNFDYSIIDLEQLLYGGIHIFISFTQEMQYQIPPEAIQAKKNGWNQLLADILYNPPKLDYHTNKGWFVYASEAQHLNGVFCLEGGKFVYSHSNCLLNPFVELNRNYPSLEKIKHYVRSEK